MEEREEEENYKDVAWRGLDVGCGIILRGEEEEEEGRYDGRLDRACGYNWKCIDDWCCAGGKT